MLCFVLLCSMQPSYCTIAYMAMGNYYNFVPHHHTLLPVRPSALPRRSIMIARGKTTQKKHSRPSILFKLILCKFAPQFTPNSSRIISNFCADPIRKFAQLWVLVSSIGGPRIVIMVLELLAYSNFSTYRPDASNANFVCAVSTKKIARADPNGRNSRFDFLSFLLMLIICNYALTVPTRTPITVDDSLAKRHSRSARRCRLAF